MQPADEAAAPGQRHVDRAGFQRFHRFGFELTLALRQLSFEFGPYRVGGLAVGSTLRWRQRADLAQGKRNFALAPEVGETPGVQRFEISCGFEGCESPR